MNPFRGSSERPRAWLSTGIGMVHRHRDGLLHAFADQLSATVACAELVGRLVPTPYGSRTTSDASSLPAPEVQVNVGRTLR